MGFEGWQGSGYHPANPAESGYQEAEWRVTYLAQNGNVVDRCGDYSGSLPSPRKQKPKGQNL